MDQLVTGQSISIEHLGITIFLPMPMLLVVEDVGWWQGHDGSSQNQPYRNNLNRRHCLADYQALARLAEKLKIGIVLGMVMCEWDRTNCLSALPDATWMGEAWDNSANKGPWLDEASEYITSHRHLFEPSLHGLGHEYWPKGRMERSEFHDADGRMRPETVVRNHLDAFAAIWEQNFLLPFPKIFIPPALNHSFGDHTFQPLLKEYGIEYVITRFSKARQYSTPVHSQLTWESGIALLERGEAPVSWDKVGAEPVWAEPQPIIPFHWSNLLHENPQKNFQVVDAWAALLAKKMDQPDMIPAADAAQFYGQAAVCFLGRMSREKRGVSIDIGLLPDMPDFSGQFCLNIAGDANQEWECRGGEILFTEQKSPDLKMIGLQFRQGSHRLDLFP